MTMGKFTTEEAKKHIYEADKILGDVIVDLTNHINQLEKEIASPDETDKDGKRHESNLSKNRRKAAEKLRVRVRAAQLADDPKWMRIDWWSGGCFCAGGVCFAIVTSALGGTLWDIIKGILTFFPGQ